jgi:signal transduction histidine kinase
VELHGGTIGVDSQFGEGSTFTIELPLAPQPAGGAMPLVLKGVGQR